MNKPTHVPVMSRYQFATPIRHLRYTCSHIEFTTTAMAFVAYHASAHPKILRNPTKWRREGVKMEILTRGMIELRLQCHMSSKSEMRYG